MQLKKSILSEIRSRTATVRGGVSERRLATRYATELGCKVRRRGGLKYDAGKTIDLSMTGVAFESAEARSFVPGESLEIGVLWDVQDSLIERSALIRGVVTRVQDSRDGAGTVSVAILPISGEKSAEIWANGISGIAQETQRSLLNAA